jgi:DNA-directed RNA polymerase sigma subunit (sigma70/sigma32)
MPCPIEDCRMWIPYEKDFNCTHEAIYKNDALTLREVAERLELSFVRIKQIQDAALKKIGNLVDKESI